MKNFVSWGPICNFYKIEGPICNFYKIEGPNRNFPKFVSLMFSCLFKCLFAKFGLIVNAYMWFLISFRNYFIIYGLTGDFALNLVNCLILGIGILIRV